MTRPDSPGVWYTRNGTMAIVNGHDVARIFFPNGDYRSFTPLSEVPVDDWIKGTPPEFPPELPPKPGLVLFTQPHWTTNYWGAVMDNSVFVVSPQSGHGAVYRLAWADIVVVPHPDNDPEAVRLIEEARGAVRP